MIEHNQIDRVKINCPIPFTFEQLELMVKKCSGLEEDPDLVHDIIQDLIFSEKLSLNPSSNLGDGANVADIFSLGFMVFMKTHFDIDVDPSTLWFSPVSTQIPVKINSVDIEFEDAKIVSNEKVIYEAMLGDQIVTAEQVAELMENEPHDINEDDWEDDLPF